MTATALINKVQSVQSPHLEIGVPSPALPEIRDSVPRVERWVEEHGYTGHEPFDGLSSAFLPLMFGSVFLGRLLLQLIRQSSVDLRPIMGLKPLESTKGRGDMAAGYLRMIKVTGDQTYARGFDYFVETFFASDGLSKYYHNRAQLDIWCAAQAVETLAHFAATDVRALPTAIKVAQWTLRNMQDPRGLPLSAEDGEDAEAARGLATVYKGLCTFIERPNP